MAVTRAPYKGVVWATGRKGIQVCPCCGQKRPKQRAWWRTIQRSLDGQWRVIVRPRSYRIQQLKFLAGVNRTCWTDVQKIGRPRTMWGHTTRDDEVTAAVSALHRRMLGINP